MGLFSDTDTLIDPHAGVDEAGRGPLAGAVIAAAVILDPARPIDGLKDSKVLSPARRDELAAQIERDALAVGIGRAEVDEIDRYNILHAAMLAMQRAVAALGMVPRVVYVDGDRVPRLPMPAVAVVGGDARYAAISAASIVAKAHRDREMTVLAVDYPEYGFDEHKGYGTPEHLAALERFGPSPVHRRSFAPVRALIAAGAPGQPAIGGQLSLL